MATLIKRNARKLLAVDKLTFGYVNLPMSMLEEAKHVEAHLGDYIIRIELSKIPTIITDLNHIYNTFKDYK